mgnify:CR=1 FL=1
MAGGSGTQRIPLLSHSELRVAAGVWFDSAGRAAVIAACTSMRKSLIGSGWGGFVVNGFEWLDDEETATALC